MTRHPFRLAAWSAAPLLIISVLVIACSEHGTPDPAAPSADAAGPIQVVGTVTASDVASTDLLAEGNAGVLPSSAGATAPEAVAQARALAVAGDGAADGTHSVVIVHARTGDAPDAAAVADNFADALARVASGGTVRVLPGTYAAEDVAVDKPVTIEPVGNGEVVIVNSEGNASFIIEGIASGTVVIRGVEFRNESPVSLSASVLATGQYDAVRIEGSRFVTGDAATGGVIAFLPTDPASTVVVDGSDFRGGLIGTFASGAPAFEVRNSEYGGHQLLAASFNDSDGGVIGSSLADCGSFTCITAFNGSDAVIEGNEMSNCSPRTCATIGQDGTTTRVADNRFSDDQTDVDSFSHHTVLVHNGASGRVEGNLFDGCGNGVCILVNSRAVAEVVGNELNLIAEHGTRLGIIGSDGTGGGAPNPEAAPTLVVTDNVVRGIGGAQDPADPESFGTRFAGIGVEASARAEVYRNRVSNTRAGFGAFQGGVIFAGADNRVENVHTGVEIFEQASVTLRSSDFSDYATAIAESGNDEPGDLTCNWWGSADGPQNSAGSDPRLYMPWATEPVAGNSTTTCLGGIGVPSAGLVAHWPGDGTAEDAAGGHDGTLVGDAAFATGVVDEAFQIPNAGKASENDFTGTDWVEVPDDAAWDFGAGDFTIATWVNFSNVLSPGPHQQPLIGHSEGPGELGKWILWLQDGALTFHTNSPATGGLNPLHHVVDPESGVWIHVAVTRRGDTWRLYVNGERVQEAHSADPVPSADAPLTLGRAEDTWLEGLLDEVVVYHRALDDTEAVGLFLAGGE